MAGYSLKERVKKKERETDGFILLPLTFFCVKKYSPNTMYSAFFPVWIFLAFMCSWGGGGGERKKHLRDKAPS